MKKLLSVTFATILALLPLSGLAQPPFVTPNYGLNVPGEVDDSAETSSGTIEGATFIDDGLVSGTCMTVEPAGVIGNIGFPCATVYSYLNGTAQSQSGTHIEN